MTQVLFTLLVLSLIGNAGLLFLYIKLKHKKPPQTQSVELRTFLADLLAGPAMLAVARIDPNDILMRSPKQR